MINFPGAIILVIGTLATFPAWAETQNVIERPGWVVHVTKYSYAIMNKKLDTSIMANKMLRVTQASASAGAKGRGITIPGNRILGVYRNDFAVRMLEASVAAGIEAPIRYYVTENEDGSSTLSYKTPSAVFSPYYDSAGKLEGLATELDVLFGKIAEEAIAD